MVDVKSEDVGVGVGWGNSAFIIFLILILLILGMGWFGGLVSTFQRKARGNYAPGFCVLLMLGVFTLSRSKVSPANLAGFTYIGGIPVV